MYRFSRTKSLMLLLAHRTKKNQNIKRLRNSNLCISHVRVASRYLFHFLQCQFLEGNRN